MATAAEVVKVDMRRQHPVNLSRREAGRCDALHKLLQRTGGAGLDYGIFLVEPYINSDEVGNTIRLQVEPDQVLRVAVQFHASAAVEG